MNNYRALTGELYLFVIIVNVLHNSTSFPYIATFRVYLTKRDPRKTKKVTPLLQRDKFLLVFLKFVSAHHCNLVISEKANLI